MIEFKYVATKRSGEKVEGLVEAESREKAVDSLHEQGLLVVSVDEKIGINFKKLGSLQIGGLPLKEKVFFTKQLSTMLSAGLPVTQALDILANQIKNTNLRTKMKDILEEIKGGNNVSKAFAKYPTIFDTVQINLLRAGEESGNLSEVVGQIAKDLEKSHNLNGKIKGAMIYPTIIFFAVGVVFFIMLVFMIPAVKDLYADFGGAELPGITKFLVVIGDFVRSPIGIFTILGGGLFSFIGYKFYESTPGGRSTIDNIVLKLPVFGGLNTKIQITQMTRLLGMLLKSGVPIVDSLKIVADALPNVHFQRTIENATKEVSKGIPLASPLSKSKYIPVIVSQMIATGEETGKLDQVLGNLEEFYDAEVNDITNNLTKLMEPLILLIVGGLVAFLAIAIYLPIYQIGQLVE